QVLELLREHAARLAGLEEHERAEALLVRVVRGQPVQPQRQADRQQTRQERRREQAHAANLAMRRPGRHVRARHCTGRSRTWMSAREPTGMYSRRPRAMPCTDMTAGTGDGARMC